MCNTIKHYQKPDKARNKKGILRIGLSYLWYLIKKKNALLRIFLLIVFNGYTCYGNSPEKLHNEFKFSGFIKYDIFSDTRQTVNAREGLVVLYPENIFLDKNSNDINARNSLNMLSIHSRLRCNIAGPTLLNARTSGLVEADFYGNENKNFSDLNGFRLFNAYVKFDWGKTNLLAGQYWHPMSIPGFFPATVAFSAGAPFHPMSRNPQIRLLQSWGKLNFIGSLLSQRDFSGTGPDGPSSKYLRNSGLPNIHFQVQYGSNCSCVKAGTGIDFKKIVPELSTENDAEEIFSTNTSLSSISYTGFVFAQTKHLTITTQVVYGQNTYDLLMLGGYVVKEVISKETAEKNFMNLNTASVWTDIQTNEGKFIAGIFGGFSKNMGARDFVEGPFYSRGSNIDTVYRLAPRIIYNNLPVTISMEGELTTVGYGIVNGDKKGGTTSAKSVLNLRTLLSLKYIF